MVTVKHSGSVKFADVLRIAKQMQIKSMAKDLKGTVKEILGTCVSVGCKVDDMSPKDVIAQVDSGEKEVK